MAGGVSSFSFLFFFSRHSVTAATPSEEYAGALFAETFNAITPAYFKALRAQSQVGWGREGRGRRRVRGPGPRSLSHTATRSSFKLYFFALILLEYSAVLDTITETSCVHPSWRERRKKVKQVRVSPSRPSSREEVDGALDGVRAVLRASERALSLSGGGGPFVVGDGGMCIRTTGYIQLHGCLTVFPFKSL